MAGIVLGKDLAQKLGVSLGDSVEVLTPEGTLTPVGRLAADAGVQGRRHVQPRALRVRQCLRLRAPAASPSSCSTGARPDFIEVKVDDLFAAQEVAAGIPARLGIRV